MKKTLLYEGKAKKIYETDQPHVVLVEYKNSLTAFNALKKGEFEGKGQINRDVTSLIFRELTKSGIPTHWIQDVGLTEMLVHQVSIIPIEVVVRNILAGSTAKKFGINEGKVLHKPLVEFYYKNDNLQDPFMSDDQALMMGIVIEKDIAEMKDLALKINEQLKMIFEKIGIRLVDFKIEFGKKLNGQIVLADEITPDCCRLWDVKTNEKLDKDRFRRDLGYVKESYEEVLQRLKGSVQ
ncbi:MAG: phosphoribosylaminoimidazole-succinocarboxamide synthase [Oligoflexia bacterium]|nr:MAG: phosphoribosylaminoimidazole-succinocarboxamide synthase [Oligoflexia bacterium]